MIDLVMIRLQVIPLVDFLVVDLTSTLKIFLGVIFSLVSLEVEAVGGEENVVVLTFSYDIVSIWPLSSQEVMNP